MLRFISHQNTPTGRRQQGQSCPCFRVKLVNFVQTAGRSHFVDPAVNSPGRHRDSLALV